MSYDHPEEDMPDPDFLQRDGELMLLKSRVLSKMAQILYLQIKCDRLSGSHTGLQQAKDEYLRLYETWQQKRIECGIFPLSCSKCNVQLDETDVCPECHVYYGDPCGACKQRGYHTDHCPEAG